MVHAKAQPEYMPLFQLMCPGLRRKTVDVPNAVFVKVQRFVGGEVVLNVQEIESVQDCEGWAETAQVKFRNGSATVIKGTAAEFYETLSSITGRS